MKHLLLTIFVFLTSCADYYDLKDRGAFISDRDYNIYLLERLGQGECSICDTIEIKMVMSVAVNRVNNHRFPNNLHDVLYADNQFHGMYRSDRDASGNVIISDKVKYCAKFIVDSGSILPANITGFLYPQNIKTSRGLTWYNKIKDSVEYKMQYHHFYKGRI